MKCFARLFHQASTNLLFLKSFNLYLKKQHSSTSHLKEEHNFYTFEFVSSQTAKVLCRVMMRRSVEMIPPENCWLRAEEPLSAKLEWILCHFLASKNAVPQFTVFDFTNFPLTRRVFFLCKVSRYLITIYIFVLIDFVPTNNQNLLMTHCEN